LAVKRLRSHRAKRCRCFELRRSERCKIGLDPGRRESVARRHTRLAKSDAGVAEPGPKGHRILRRVPIDGRHLGSSRASSFHEGLVTVVSAASSRGKLERRAEHEGDSDIPRKRERRQGCQRLDRIGRRGKKTPTLESTTPKEQDRGSACPVTIRRSGHGCRETPGPPVSREEP